MNRDKITLIIRALRDVSEDEWDFMYISNAGCTRGCAIFQFPKLFPEIFNKDKDGIFFVDSGKKLVSYDSKLKEELGKFLGMGPDNVEAIFFEEETYGVPYKSVTPTMVADKLQEYLDKGSK